MVRTRFSPLAVRGMLDVPVCFPESDHSVSPWRTMKQRGVVIVDDGAGEKSKGSIEERKRHGKKYT